MESEWLQWMVSEVVHEVPQLVLLVLAFAFTTGALLALFITFEYIYRRMTATPTGGGGDLLMKVFHRDVAALDQMVDDIEALQRLRDQQGKLAQPAPPSFLHDGDDFDVDIEHRIALIKQAWSARREHLLRKQQLLRISACVCATLILFWRLGALDSRWCVLSTTHRQLVHSLLAHTTAVLNANGVEHWVDGATLLAVYRDNTLSEWDDRLVLATWKENQPKLWNALRPALEQRERYYLEKYRAPVLSTANPPAFRLHYASLQRHFNKMPYLDIYLYNREGGTGKDKPDAETPQVKESAVLPLRNLTLVSSSLTYHVPLPRNASVFLARLLGEAFDAGAVEEAHQRSEGRLVDDDGLRGYKALTCLIYHDRNNNLGLFAMLATFIYFVLVIYALPRASFNARWRF